MKYRSPTSVVAAATLLLLTACGDSAPSKADAKVQSTAGLPRGSEPVTLNPADFSVDITNE